MSALNSLLSHLERRTVATAKAEVTDEYRKAIITIGDGEQLVLIERFPQRGRGGSLTVMLNGIVIMEK